MLQMKNEITEDRWLNSEGHTAKDMCVFYNKFLIQTLVQLPQENHFLCLFLSVPLLIIYKTP
jgi:hypothetical protein